MSFRPLQIRWQSEGLATTSDSTTRAISPWLYSATRSLRWGIGDGVGYGVPKLQIRPGHSQRKPQCSSLQGWDFGRVSGALLWRPCLSHRPIFMHEGATPHTARISMAFLCQSAMEVLPWPSLSPDLNPIEYVWGYIRRHLNEMDPRVQSLDELREAIHEVWRHIYDATPHGSLLAARPMIVHAGPFRYICHSSMSDVWFIVCGGEWQQSLRQMVAPHITDCYSVIIVKFLFVYLPLRDLICDK